MLVAALLLLSNDGPAVSEPTDGSGSGAGAVAACRFASAAAWVLQCELGEDCTAETSFCACCDLHAAESVYAEACGALCGSSTRGASRDDARAGFDFQQFGEVGAVGDEHGPYFRQSELSLVGDAAVVLGDCYTFDVRAAEREDGGQDACLLPPTPTPLFALDQLLPVSLSICNATTAPFHLEDAAAYASLICHEECHSHNVSVRQPEPPTVDHDQLWLANCTRHCFGACSSPQVPDGCIAACGAADQADFHCMSACHANLSVCHTPTAPRNTRTFRDDPNVPLCKPLQPEYVDCVASCGTSCHVTLNNSHRTAQDEADDWYRQICGPPAAQAGRHATACHEQCLGDCMGGCSREVELRLDQYEYLASDAGPTLAYANLFDCGANCTHDCVSTCDMPGERFDAASKCRPPPFYNCSAGCYGLHCEAVVTFCSVFDLRGQLGFVDTNCTREPNVTLAVSLANITLVAQLMDEESWLSTLVSVNQSRHTCYTECDSSASSWQMAEFGSNCTTRCFTKLCLQDCEANCTREAEIAALPACVLGPGCLDAVSCGIANCSWEMAVLLAEQPTINITEVSANASAGLWVAPWNEAICEEAVGESLDSYFACIGQCYLRCERHCSRMANFTEIPGVNDTSGVCMAQCAQACPATCGPSLEVDQCEPPEAPTDDCWPPPNCTYDCSAVCFDTTVLLQDPSCEVISPGDNDTVVSLYYEYNATSERRCAGNVSSAAAAAGNCSSDDAYHEVNLTSGNIFVREECIRSCFSNCSSTCVDQYCTLEMKEPVNYSAVCLPRCMERIMMDAFVPPSPPLVNATANLSSCVSPCLANCTRSATPSCSMRCEPLLQPANWHQCFSACISEEAAACGQDCVYSCTANHTLAYSKPAPYDASDDYLTYDQVWEATLSSQERWERELTWSNQSATCFANCSRSCGLACFESAASACDMAASALPPIADPRRRAQASNNCTQRESTECLQGCGEHCAINRCQNMTEHDRVMTAVELLAKVEHEESALFDLYVESCQAKCKRQIYGVNATRYSRCEWLYNMEGGLVGYHQHCLLNCTSIATDDCSDRNSSIDVTGTCNATCFHHLRAASSSGRDGAQNSTGLGDTDEAVEGDGGTAPDADQAMDVTSLADLAALNSVAGQGDAGMDGASDEEGDYVSGSSSDAYPDCMVRCRDNYTSNSAFSCDSGDALAAAVDEYGDMRESYLLEGSGEMSFQAEKALREWKAAQPSSWDTVIDQVQAGSSLYAASEGGTVGALCYPVDVGCLVNATRRCGKSCGELVSRYQQMCFADEEYNASFAHNVTSCRLPEPYEGALVGQPKYVWYQQHNASHPLATPPQKVRRAPVWTFDEVADGSVLNCSCHFENQTWSPEFLAKMLEYDMVPHRDHYVSECACFFNATSQEPQHCVQTNTSSPNLFDWVFSEQNAPEARPNGVVETARAFVACATPCVSLCYQQCGAHFLEDVWGNGSLVANLSIKGPIGPGLRGLVNLSYAGNGSAVIADGMWQAAPSCLEPCLRTCATQPGHRSGGDVGGNCSTNCRSGCDPWVGNPLIATDGNQTAIDFACIFGAAPVEGQPFCNAACDCHVECVDECVSGLSVIATSAEQFHSWPECLTNCSNACRATHDDVCRNVSAAAQAVGEVAINETATCMGAIWPACSLHCLGVSVQNTTVNSTLFPSSLIPAELLTLNLLGDAEGYECALQPCEEGAPGWGECNQTVVQVDSKTVVDPESGNVSVVPVLQNASRASYLGCVDNRSSTCLSACHAVGDKICFPDTDPFDLCVQSCVANLTYEPPMQVHDHSVGICKKQLRLTPSEEQRAGAAWYFDQQHVRQGFETAFTFRLGHGSRRCSSAAHPSHDERPESLDHLCEFGSGDGFAFVVQDSGHTGLEPFCTTACLRGCQTSGVRACLDSCRSACPASVNQAGATCIGTCIAGGPTTASTEPVTDVVAAAAAAAATVAASSACPPFIVDCLPGCVTEDPLSLWVGQPALPGGCVYTCVEEESRREYCPQVCPLVDEDVDFGCIDACVQIRLEAAAACISGCNSTCGTRAALVGAACERGCEESDAALPSGELVRTCTRMVEARSPDDASLCLASCGHDDRPCWAGCVVEAPGSVEGCVGACSQNDTACAVRCLDQRDGAAAQCALPCLEECPHESTALGENANGAGFAALRNVLAVKFDTWFNSESNEPHHGHIAVHSGGHGIATTDADRALGLAYPVPLADGQYHSARIIYEPTFDPHDDITTQTSPASSAMLAQISQPTTTAGGTADSRKLSQPDERLPTAASRPDSTGMGLLRVLVDEEEVLSVPLNLDTLLDLDSGLAYVGFTGATGLAYQEHAIARWEFSSSAVE